MVANLTASRSDLIYLKRRPKMGEIPRETPAARASFVLDSPIVVAPLAPSKPVVLGRVILSLDSNPVVRLNKRQSAIGSLLISGAESFAWDTGTDAGMENLSGRNSPIPMFSNRKLVEFYQGEVAINLRHFREFKRIIVAATSGVMEMKLYDGSTVVADSNGGKTVIYIARVKDMIEIRVESLSQTLEETFSIHSNI